MLFLSVTRKRKFCTKRELFEKMVNQEYTEAGCSMATGLASEKVPAVPLSVRVPEFRVGGAPH